MKLVIGIIALCIGAVLAQGPSRSEVRDAITRARALNDANRDLNRNNGFANCDRPKKCPLAKFHGRRASNSVLDDMTSNDLLTARRLLLESGFTEADLNTEAVIEEFEIESALTCNTPVNCDETERFRTADGTCNNRDRPRQGSAGAAQIRLLKPAYDDGVSSPRVRSVVPGELLPNPRVVSNIVHRAGRRLIRSERINLHVFQMGQFLDHDIIATPIQGEVEDCCNVTGDTDNCFPIRIDFDDDRTFDEGYCMNFHRSAPFFCPSATEAISDERRPMSFVSVSSRDVNVPRREQINAITSFIDASNVYGSSLEEQFNLREDGTGFMAVDEPDNRLPNSDEPEACLSDVENGIFCSRAGDHRVNVVPSLTAYHNLFVREHNRIAEQLETIYEDEEILFQETRKILIAVMQKVVYDEFLPAFLSSETMDNFQLRGSSTPRYSEDIDPTVSNAFGIAYRMGHTWIPRTMEIFNTEFETVVRQRTENTYFEPNLTYLRRRGGLRGMDGLALWLTGENSAETDRIIENAARNNLFRDEDGNSFDLAALNLQRARDHGLPSYTAYRVFCELDTAETEDFDDLEDIDEDNIKRLRKAYEDPRDIDMFTGALVERPVEEGSLGPVLECILGDQFSRLKYGDRFWYQGEGAGFNDAQLEAIQTYSMAKVLCNNYIFDTVNFPNAFLATDRFESCDEIPQLDLSVFGVTNPRNSPTPRTTRGPRESPSGPTVNPGSTRPPRPRPTGNPGSPRPPRPGPGGNGGNGNGGTGNGGNGNGGNGNGGNGNGGNGNGGNGNGGNGNGRTGTGGTLANPLVGSGKRGKDTNSHIDELLEDLLEKLQKED